ncbi:T-cell surface antigen CD2 isoform X2 [Protopterus annectens]|uniref:T-cell surface antigen CD2 isoform X2 n=1 Tax=Protopterus annectens TaxID=7888 RepID=UPI001CF9A6DC|nr:T-cell surface antigen CD2 isoform X2 [Protopterus annectens]
MNNKGSLLEFIIFICLSLTGSEDSKCDVITPVYGLLNASVTLHFGQALKPNSSITWKANPFKIGNFKDNEYLPTPSYQGRAKIFSNGSLTIFSLRTTDKRVHQVEIHDGRTGQHICSGNVNLQVLEKLKTPTITLNGTFLTCTAENLYVERFYLKKDGKVLSDKEVKIINKNNNSIVYDIQQITGNLECVANNTLNENSAVILMQKGHEQLNIYIIASVAGGGVLLVLCIALLIYCIVRQQKHHRTPVYEDNSQLYFSVEHDTEIYFRRPDSCLLENNACLDASQ